jgi:hypothetical protein
VILVQFQDKTAAVAPFTYTNLIWAASYGLLIFGEWPDFWTIAGAVVIAGSGLYIYHREQVLKARNSYVAALDHDGVIRSAFNECAG